MESIISVIIPVYNVEKYLVKCVESVMQQTNKNLQILLVDDGSKDSSGILCDELANKDQRIMVIHKENGGVSSARNVGLENATGEYVCFVDSDDYIEIDMYQKLYEQLEEKHADIAICNCFFEKGYGTDCYKESDVVDCYEGLKVFEYAYRNRYVENRKLMLALVTNKLYRKSCLKGRKFLEDIAGGEDIIFNTYVFENAKKICVLYRNFYHYVERGDSFTNNKFSVSRLDSIKAESKYLNYIKDKVGRRTLERLYEVYYDMAIRISKMIVDSELSQKDQAKYIKYIQRYLKRDRNMLLKDYRFCVKTNQWRDRLFFMFGSKYFRICDWFNIYSGIVLTVERLE